MLSVQACSARMAMSYYKADDYYTRDMTSQDTWHGKLCSELGIEEGSVVDPESFNMLLESSGEKCCAYDLTFSAPKSVSIVAELSEEGRKDMLEAHHKAVYRTLDEIENELAGTRTKHDGVITHHRTGNMAVACFDHYVSRDNDMQLHTHAVAINKTSFNGEGYALDGYPFFTTQKIYGMEYRNNLAEELRSMGYELVITDPDKGFFEIAGVNPEVIKHFSKRRNSIEEELEKNGLYGGKAAGKAAIKTRKAKEHIDIAEKRQEWAQELCELGQAPITKHKQPELSFSDEVNIGERAISKLEAQHFAWGKEEFIQAIMAEGCGYGITKDSAEKLIDKTSARAILPQQGSQLQGLYYTTENNINMEKEILARVRAGKDVVSGLKVSDVEKSLNSLCRDNDWKLGKQQENVVYHIACSNDQFIAVRGLAGAGKTFTLNAARAVMEEHGYEVKGMSATGQAATELSADAHIAECSTINRALNQAERAAGNTIDGEDLSEKKYWNFDGLGKSEKPTVWFVDEASLTNDTLFVHIQRMAGLRGDKVVFIGDDKQMPPVGAGNAFSNMIQKGEISKVELSDIIRQEDPRLLEAVRESVLGKTKDALKLLGEDITEVPTRGRRLNAIVSEYMELSRADQKNTLVLTATNNDRVELNQRIRKKLVKRGDIQQGEAFKVQYGKDNNAQERYFAAGDSIIFLQNDRKLGVMNGTKAYIDSIDGGRFNVTTLEGTEISFDIDKYNHVDYGMVQTPHKAQGATYKRAIIHLDSKDKKLNSKNSFYVDISRAKQNVKIFCDSTQKLEGQISEFAKKLTSYDFELDQKKDLNERYTPRKEKTLKKWGLSGKNTVIKPTGMMLSVLIELIKKPLEIVHEAAQYKPLGNNNDGPKL